jgi:nitrate reductase gamma subunit
MSETELLTWLRGPGLQIAVMVFVLGLAFRVIQNLTAGLPKNLAEPKGSTFGPGVATIFRRFKFYRHATNRGYFTILTGYTFHIGLFLTLFFLDQHILLFENILGFGWPALPPVIITFTALVSIAALVAVLVYRIMDPVRRQLTVYQDYMVWVLTIGPLITGYLTMHPLGLSYTILLSIHIISAGLLLIAIPFTSLSHMVSLFISRWYNGALAGYKGAKS